MADPLAGILSARGGLTFNQAFAAARARGDATFEWMNPQTGKVGLFTTARADDKRMRLPRGMKESDLYRDPAREQPMRDSEARQRAIEEQYQQNLRDIRSEFEAADKRDLQRYTSDMAPFERDQQLQGEAVRDLENLRAYEAREAVEAAMQEAEEPERVRRYNEIQQLRALQNQLQQQVYRNEQTALQREIDENEQKVLQEWAAGKRKEQALEPVYPEMLAPVGRAAVSTGKAAASGIMGVLNRLRANSQPRPRREEPNIQTFPTPRSRREPEMNFQTDEFQDRSFIPSYQAGGMVGPGGMPEPMGVGVSEQMVGQGSAMSPQMMETQVNQFTTQHPQQTAQIRDAIMAEMQSGELTQQELNMIVQLATVAAQNPEMYPYVRNFAIQQGIATEQDLPPQYDQGLLFVILVAARAVQQDTGGQNMMQGGSPMMAGGPEVAASQVSSGAIPSMARGGMTPDSAKADGSVLINAHEGEYVVPANVVKMKGKEFFDSLVEKYRDNK